jgi:isopenicillin N synthase-like dioxygenase
MADPANVPVSDLSIAAGEDLVTGLQQTSCVFLTGLASIPSELEAVMLTSRAFFSLSDTEKKLVEWSGTGEWAGWQPLYASGGAALPLERFEVALPNPDNFVTREEWAKDFAQWPARPADMSSVWGTYYLSMRALTERVITMLADTLGLPSNDIPAWTTHQHSNRCVNHYLAQVDAPKPGQIRQKAHTDMGGLTLLWADGRAGLEAQIGPDGAWLPVTFPPDSLLLQAGDLLHLWSRGTIPANNHRVVNPPRRAGVTQTDRYSLVYFHHPDLDTWIAPPGDAHGGVNARDYVLERQRQAYSPG